jgi:hypothetical protein
MSTTLQKYEEGLRHLLARLGKDHPNYRDVLLFQARFTENIERAQLYGDDDANSADRMQIINGLNDLALQAIDISFNELCGLQLVSEKSEKDFGEGYSQGDSVSQLQIPPLSLSLLPPPPTPTVQVYAQETFQLLQKALALFEREGNIYQFESVKIRKLLQQHAISAQAVIVGIAPTTPSLSSLTVILHHIKRIIEEIAELISEFEAACQKQAQQTKRLHIRAKLNEIMRYMQQQKVLHLTYGDDFSAESLNDGWQDE